MVAWGRSWDGLGWVVLWDGRDGRDGVFPFPSFVASRDQRLSLPACHRGCEHRALFWAGPRLRYPAASCVTPSPPNSPCLVDFARLCSQNRQHGPAQTPRSALRPSRPFQKGCVEILTHAPCPPNAGTQNPTRASSESTLSLRGGAPPVPAHVFWSSARRSLPPCLPQVRTTVRAPLMMTLGPWHRVVQPR